RLKNRIPMFGCAIVSPRYWRRPCQCNPRFSREQVALVNDHFDAASCLRAHGRDADEHLFVKSENAAKRPGSSPGRFLSLLKTDNQKLTTSRCRTKGRIASTQLTEKSNRENGKN